jgi:Prokaryotic Cytochrome C oxidase subunit IV
MRRVFDSRLVVLWLFLVLATALSFGLGTDHDSAIRTTLSAAVIVVAFIKFRLVGIHFMELGRAPRLLRTLFEGYVVIVGVTILSLYLIT